MGKIGTILIIVGLIILGISIPQVLGVLLAVFGVFIIKENLITRKYIGAIEKIDILYDKYENTGGLSILECQEIEKQYDIFWEAKDKNVKKNSKMYIIRRAMNIITIRRVFELRTKISYQRGEIV